MTDEASTLTLIRPAPPRPAALTEQAACACAALTSAEQVIHTAGACPLETEGRTVAVGEHQGPSTVLGPSVLDWPQQLVEVEAIAVTSAPAAAR